MTDPREVHAVAAKLLEFLSEQTDASPEVQTGALQVAATALQETIRINNANAMSQEVRSFWRRK